MGFNINGTKLLVETNTLKIKDVYSSTEQLTYDNTGLLKRSSTQPMFYACDTGAAWTGLGGAASTWIAKSFPNIIVNQNSCFAGSTFTAPITGAYVFTANEYCLNNSGSTGNLVYFAFGVNGSTGSRKFNGQTNYRTNGYFVTSGYAFDGQMNDIYYLQAGDYVNVYRYFNISAQFYGTYGHFAGWLLG